MNLIFSTNSILLLPLAGCALLAIAIVLERLWVLRFSVVAPASRVRYFYSVASEPDVLAELQQSMDNNPLQRLVVAALQHQQDGMQAMRNAVRAEGDLLSHDLQRFMSTLGTIAMIAPLLGLLGTVLGMIDVFSAIIDREGSAISPALSAGIAEALITTAIGLSIAIPAVFFHRLLQQRIHSLLVEMEKLCMHILREYR